LDIEQQHLTRETNELGHQVITIEAFSEQELADLEASLWTQLDEILDVKQQGLMRYNLGVHVGEGSSQEASMHWWKPRVLGWGREGARIELWKVGTWFHWKARIRIGSSMISGKAPELPPEFQRFWQVEAESGTTETHSSSSIDTPPDSPQK
jgi:hypothetical protein